MIKNKNWPCTSDTKLKLHKNEKKMYILFHSSSSSSFTFFFFFFFFFSVDCKESIYEDSTKYLKEKKKEEMDQKVPLLRWTLLVPQLQPLAFPFSSSSLEFPLLLQLLPLLQNSQRILASPTLHPIMSFIFPFYTPMTGSFLDFLGLAAGVSGASS